MRDVDAGQLRRGRQWVTGLAAAAAVVLTAWRAWSVPFSQQEARFVHESLRSSGQIASPDFGASQGPVPADVLTVLRQLVGTSEAALRLLILATLMIAGLFLAELVPDPRLPAALVPVLFLAAAALSAPDRIVLPQALIVLPAALALLAAPIGGPVTNARAVPALLGALAAGSIAAEAAIVVAATLAAAALVRGTLLERLTALLTAAAGLALAWVVHGPFAELARLLPDELPVRSASVLANPVAPIAAGVVLGTASLFARDAARPQRVALMAATLAGCACVFFFVWKVSSTRGFPAGLWIAVSAATPPGLVLLAAAANALGPAVRWLVALALLAACAWFVRHPPAPPEPAAAGILAQARAVAQPGSALAVHGDTRVGMAVYARLGHAPAMPLIHVPEQAPFAGLADFCRRLGVRQLWVHPPLPEAPPGFSSPESRPGGAADLTYLVVEQS